MRAIRASKWAWLVLICSVAASNSASAIDVERIEWGFDGRAVPMVFNMVTIEVANNSATPFEGDISLEEGRGVSQTDLPLIERNLYIEPYGRRRLQFFPFISETYTDLTLVTGKRPEDRRPVVDISQPLRSGPRAIVLLRDASTSRMLRSRLPTFDEADFPISVAGTDALRTVVLDHVPRWDALRMQAFRDWIGAGGQVRVLHDAAGAYPKFPPPLEGLNEPSDAVTIGAGRVFHDAFAVGAITDEFLESSLGLARPSQDDNNQSRRNYNDYQFQPSNSIAPLLRDLTRPDHNWALIYVLSFAYLLVVFPGCWLLGRRRADFRISYPALLAAVFVFSMAFKTVGQRGYGEETAWNAVGTARRVAPGRFLTEMWSNAFVTTGGMYSFQHAGEGQIYSSGGSNDTRRGACFNRPNPGIETEIPPFSSQTIMHTAVVTAPDFDVAMEKADVSSGVPSFEFVLSGQAPAFTTLHVAYGDQWLQVARDGDHLRASSASRLEQFLQNSPGMYPGQYRTNVDLESTYQAAEVPLVSRSLRVSRDDRDGDVRMPKGIVRLFLYGPMPAEFLDVKGGPAKRQGRMLYVFDFPIEEK